MRIFLVLIIAFLSVGFKADRYLIKGNIQTKNNGYIYLLNGNDTLAKGVINGGKFTVPIAPSVTAQQPSIYLLVWGESRGSREAIVVDAQNIEVNITDGKVDVKGGKLQEQLSRFTADEREFDRQMDELDRAYENEEKAKNYFGTRVVQAKAQKLEAARSANENLYIAANDNVVGAYIIKKNLNANIKSKKIIEKYELLGANGRLSYIGKELEVSYNAAKVIAVGSAAPDFTLKSHDGKEVSLYGMKAKMKIIDFWASWCGPCRAENPHMLKVYETYKDKGLEIIGISLDGDRQKWLDAIKKDDLPWVQLSALKGWDCPVAIKYAVRSIPTTIIVDENNRIIGIKLRGEDLDKFLEKNFK